eukprot:SAG31_NODE_24618_length_477_cov_15.317460_1_plen_73_part_10
MVGNIFLLLNRSQAEGTVDLAQTQRQIFDHYDVDGSGLLDRDEILLLLHDLFESAIVQAERDGAHRNWVELSR